MTCGKKKIYDILIGFRYNVLLVIKSPLLFYYMGASCKLEIEPCLKHIVRKLPGISKTDISLPHLSAKPFSDEPAASCPEHVSQTATGYAPAFSNLHLSQLIKCQPIGF